MPVRTQTLDEKREAERPFRTVQVGGAVKLMSLAYLLETFRCGILSLRKLLRDLKVPVLEFDGVEYVNQAAIELALWSVTAPGQPDFFGPKSPTLHKRGRTEAEEKGITAIQDDRWATFDVEGHASMMHYAARLHEAATRDAIRKRIRRLVESQS